jgi:hypothetical protein
MEDMSETICRSGFKEETEMYNKGAIKIRATAE